MPCIPFQDKKGNVGIMCVRGRNRFIDMEAAHKEANAAAARVRASMAGEFTVGGSVEHDVYGGGIVEEMRGTGEQAQITIAFYRFGNKTFLLEFARARLRAV